MMKNRLLSCLLVVAMIVTIFPMVVFGASEAGFYKDSITLKVGQTSSVSFTYGSSASSATVVVSSLDIDAYVYGTTVSITGRNECTAYVTLNFDDGTSDDIKVEVTKTGKGTSSSDDDTIELKKGYSKSIYIDLDDYDARRAVVSYESRYVSVNKTTFTSSGNLKITGRYAGDTEVKIRYYTSSYSNYYYEDYEEEIYYIEVVNSYSSGSNYSDDEIEVDIDETEYYYIDLDDYDATRATITYDDEYISVNKTTFTSSGNLRITGEYRGEAEVRIKYNSGETIYLTVYVDGYSDYDEDYEEEDYDEIMYLEEGESDTYYIDLDAYNSSKATITYSSTYVSVNKTTFYDSDELEIMAKKEGDCVVKIKYSNGRTEKIYVEIEEGYYSEPSVSVEDIEVEKGYSESIRVYLGGCDKATLSMSNSNATVSKSTMYSDSNVSIRGVKVGSSVLRIKFDDGTKINVNIEITDKNYEIPTAELESTKLFVNEETVLNIYTGSDNTYYTLILDNPAKVKAEVIGYTSSKKEYKIYSSKEKYSEVKIKGLALVNGMDLTVKFPDGKEYNFEISVVNSKQNTTDGISKNGKNYLLKDGIDVDRNYLKNGYISGYADGTFGPEKSITREEFGVILSRIFTTDKKVTQSHYVNDVTASWSKDGIAKIVAMGIVTNTTNYRPSLPITRGEVAEMLYNALDLSDFSTSCNLTDLGNSALDRKIAQCYNAGVIAGYSDGTFKSYSTITRAEAVTMINRIMYENMKVNKSNRFSDVNSSHWAYDYILKASQN